MNTVYLLWLLLGLGLLVYVLTAGADFGGGVWHLLARGPRRAAQRRAIEHAIAPIWEANHVWLIFIIVLCFTAFAPAFFAISIALHIPITLALFGIVLRGAAFVFRTYGMQARPMREAWGNVFAYASLVTPVFLGMTLGALATGRIRFQNGQVTTGFFTGWTSPFAIAVGCFALALFALLAAVYMTVDAPDSVREDFRRRAIAAEGVAFVVASAVLWTAYRDAPPIWQNFVDSPWMVPMQGLTAVAAALVLLGLRKRSYRMARAAVIAQVTFIVLGWGLGMHGYILYPDIRFEDAAAPFLVTDTLLIALPLGMALVTPSLWYLFRVFKTRDEAP